LIIVDSNVLLDIVTDDPIWKPWSLGELEKAAATDAVVINDVVYAELSVRYENLEDVETYVTQMSLLLVPMPRAALFLAGKVYNAYRASGGIRTGVLPDFFIGAHAAVAGTALVTRDPRRYKTYFPSVRLIAPA
jgi:predicted nucleic acid-binding protein